MVCAKCGHAIKYDGHWKTWIHAANNFISCIESSNWTAPYDRATPKESAEALGTIDERIAEASAADILFEMELERFGECNE